MKYLEFVEVFDEFRLEENVDYNLTTHGDFYFKSCVSEQGEV